MKISCSQCGAELPVLETDFYLRCPFCDSSIVVAADSELPWLVMPSVTERSARRLFPAGDVLDASLVFFPYFSRGQGLLPAFSQPYEELEEYVPPAGDRKAFDDDLVEPDQLIPISDDLVGVEDRETVIFHPFFIVMLREGDHASGRLVDAVSGRCISGSPDVSTEPLGLNRLFLVTLAAGLLVSVPLYFLLRAMGPNPEWRGLLTIIATAGVAYWILKSGLLR